MICASPSLHPLKDWSLRETRCGSINVEPYGYLADVITRIVNGHPQNRLDELLPWAYPAASKLKAVA